MGKKEDFIATLQACYFGDRNAFNKIVSVYDNLKQENEQLKEIENKLNFIKNRVKQGMSQENINKCAIELVNSYLKEILKEVE